MNLHKVKDDLREYLRNHPLSQPKIAQQIGVTHQWINSFVRRRTDNPTVAVLQRCYDWMQADRRSARRARAKP